MKDRQTSDKANSGRSGGVNFQGDGLSAVEHKSASIGTIAVPAKGTSNGGK